MSSVNTKRLQRTMMIYRIVQTALVGLLVFMAINFQGLFAQRGKPEHFTTSLLGAIIVQLLLIWPVYKLAWRDAGIEIEGSAPNLSNEQQAALRKKRLIGDLWKFSAVAFFIAFVALAPDAKKAAGAPLILAATIYSFLLTCLMYFQCFNYSLKKRLKESGG
ncbi:MAG TPA: hypothetical protein HPP76_02680 [Desulfuromonadales bacterium]|nr:hypothetical protein [Desulfuromonadales bacterium]